MAVHMTCSNQPLTIPTNGCDDCSKLERRVEVLEECCEQVHEELDTKADSQTTEEAIGEVESQLNALVGSWNYVDSIASSSELPTTFGEGEVYYSEADDGFYVSLVSRPNGDGTLADWGFLSSSSGGGSALQKQTFTVTAGQTTKSVTGIADSYDKIISVNAYLYETVTSTLEINQMWHSVAVDWEFFRLMNLSPPSTFWGLKVTLPQAYTEDVLVVVYYE